MVFNFEKETLDNPQKNLVRNLSKEVKFGEDSDFTSWRDKKYCIKLMEQEIEV